MIRHYYSDIDLLSLTFRMTGRDEEIEHFDLDEQTELELDGDGIPVALIISFSTERGLRVPPIISPGAVFESNVERHYTPETDTMLYEFHVRSKPVVEHFALDDEGTLLALDEDGVPVSLTIEHATERELIEQPASAAASIASD